jgi:hypothetical protein
VQDAAKSNGIVTANSSAAAFGVRIILIVSWSGYGKAHADCVGFTIYPNNFGPADARIPVQKEI